MAGGMGGMPVVCRWYGSTMGGGMFYYGWWYGGKYGLVWVVWFMSCGLSEKIEIHLKRNLSPATPTLVAGGFVMRSSTVEAKSSS